METFHPDHCNAKHELFPGAYMALKLLAGKAGEWIARCDIHGGLSAASLAVAGRLAQRHGQLDGYRGADLLFRGGGPRVDRAKINSDFK